MQGCAYVDDQYVAPEDAKISIFDWGFLHSDATYDVASVWQGKFFRVGDHIERFFASMDRLRLDPGKTRDEVRAVMHECVRRAGLTDAYVEILCTRGRPAPGSRDPRSCTNRFMAFAIPFVWIADPARQARGIDLIVSSVQRIAPQSVDPRIKNYHWLDMVAALFEAYERGGETAVLVDAHGDIAEGPGFNVFAVVDGTIVTPASGVLEGITRRTLLELAQAQGRPLRVGALPVAELRRASEVFLSSTGGGAIGVSFVDGVPVAGRAAGEFGPVTRALQAGYWALHDDPRHAEPVRGAN
ncbi:MAG TPA: aminotransferase class IV [Burkholderiaceae bacterium]|nr:aminotransferase class IV [Burkholderiaceae bacterium]